MAATEEYLVMHDTATELSLDRALAVSRELYRISRPDTARNPNDKSMYRLDWEVHPVTGQAALQINQNLKMYVHPDHDVTDLIDIIQASATQAERDAIVAALNMAVQHGVLIRFGDFLPADADIRTEAQLQNDGWLAAT